MMIAKKGSNVKLDYEGKLESGEVFDSSKHEDHSHPLEFTLGEGQVIPGFEKAVEGMKEGEEKEFSIEPKEAYGMPNPGAVQKIPRSALPQDQEPKEGMMLIIGNQEGQQFPAKITLVDKEFVTLDLNHPLAGKKLTFKIKVVEIK